DRLLVEIKRAVRMPPVESLRGDCSAQPDSCKIQPGHDDRHRTDDRGQVLQTLARQSVAAIHVLEYMLLPTERRIDRQSEGELAAAIIIIGSQRGRGKKCSVQRIGGGAGVITSP